LWLELGIFAFLSVYAIMSEFSYSGIIVSIIFYESLKIVCCTIYGIREERFIVNYIYSLFMNMIIFLLISILYFIEHLARF
jgi:hypothetical protein